MNNYNFNDFNNQNFNDDTENLRDNARASSNDLPNSNFNLNSNSATNNFTSDNQNTSPNAYEQNNFNSQTPEVAPTNVQPQMSQQPQEPFIQQPNAQTSINQQPTMQPSANQQPAAVRFNPGAESSAPVRYGATSNQVQQTQTYKYRSEPQPMSSSQVSSTPLDNFAREQTANQPKPQPVIMSEVESSNNSKKYAFFEDTEEDIVIESKAEKKEKLSKKKADKDEIKQTKTKKSIAINDDSDEVVTKKKSKAKNRPVSFIKMLGIRIIMLIPVIGLIYCLLLAILPKTNKNIRSLALTSFIFQIIGYSLLAFFCLNEGLGYLVEWFFNLTGYDSWSF